MDKILERVYHEPAEIEYIRMKQKSGTPTMLPALWQPARSRMGH
ncbi:hypothetical protein [Streptosporangium saharense]